jgi:hypothetical protein
MKSQKLKFRGMSYSFQSTQLGSITCLHARPVQVLHEGQNYFISSSLAILRENTRYFASFCRLLDVNRNINFTDIKPIVIYDNADVDKVKILASRAQRAMHPRLRRGRG